MHCLASLLFASVLVAVPSCERTRLHTPTADAGGTMALGGVTGTLADSSLVLVDAPMEVAQLLRVGTNYGSLMVVVYSDTSAVRTMVGNRWDDGASDASTVTVIPPGSPGMVKFMQDLALVDNVSVIHGPPTCTGDSVSFGTRTYLTVGEETGGNLQCPDNPTPAQEALAADCVTLTQ